MSFGKMRLEQRLKTLSLNNFEYNNLMNNRLVTMVNCMIFHIDNLDSNHHADIFIKYFMKMFSGVKNSLFSH